MKKLLIIQPSADLYGSDRILLNVLLSIQTEFDITLLIPKYGLLTDQIKKLFPNVHIIVDDIPIVAKKYLNIKGVIKLLKSMLYFRIGWRKFSDDFDVIYFNTLATIIPSIFARNDKSKRIIHIHETLPESNVLNRLLYKSLKFSNSHIICVSNAVKRNLTHILPNIDADIIYNGINPLYHMKQVEKNKIVFILPGRFKPSIKGQIIAIEAAKILNDKYPDLFILKLIGSPVNGDNCSLEIIQQEISRHKLQEVVKIVDFISETKLVYKNADVCLIPSIVPDSLPTTALEASSAGIPLIGSRIGGIPEIIIDGYNGYLVSPGDSNELSEKMEQFIVNKSLITELGQNGREIFESKFSFSSFAQNIKNVLNS